MKKLVIGLLGAWCAVAAPDSGTVVIENTHFKYTISSTGKNLGFIDRATGTDYLRPGADSPCALVRRAGKDYPVTGAVLDNRRLILRFDAAGAEAILEIEAGHSSYVRLTVESIRGADIESLVFLKVPLTLKGKPDETFGACAMSLNLSTRVDQLPALQTELRAACYRKFGLVGARVAMVGMPMSQVLPALKEVLSEEHEEMPLSKIGGPWARDVPSNLGSYLFNFGSLTETNTTDWINMAHSLGFTQIDNHGGGAAFFRFGDFELNRQKWPDGWRNFVRINANLHAAGIGSIFHTYAFFIDKHSKYVTPIPDQRLDAFRSFTLAEGVSANTAEIRVNESTTGMNTITGFFEHNSVVLHLGDELVTFDGVSQEPPWRFTGVKRGVLGTKPAAHDKGATARHLKECFGLFVPNPESSLFVEIAANHAEVVNRCGFDGIYLDAIDGSSILRGADECWYWADKFVFEIQKRLRKPVGMEMSAMWHHFWQYRTRWQAWDYPQRGHQRFIDLHAEAVNGSLLLPLHLGWWNFQRFNPPQVEPTYSDVVEHLGARLIGWDASISLTGAVDREQLQTVPLFRRAVDIIRTCEEIRLSRTCDEATKAKLRQPGKEFSLFVDAAGKPRFRYSSSTPHTTALAEPWTQAWPVNNPFTAQPLKLRLEALMSAASYDDPGAVVIADLSGQGTASPDSKTNPAVGDDVRRLKNPSLEAMEWKASTALGVALSRDTQPVATHSSGAMLMATNSGKVPRNAAWAKYQKQFNPALNLKDRQALGLWIEGDGLGELVAVRLESPQHIAFGAIADRYITVDFTGRRLITLVETESARWNDYVWNDGKGLYNVYRETINFNAVESVGVWMQNLPPGKEVKCRIGPVKALPMLPCTLKDPAITVNGATITFPTEMTSGCWLEWDGAGSGLVYSPKGELQAKVSPRGGPPTLRPGQNQLQFSCTPVNGPDPRAKVTLFGQGPPL